MITPEIFIETLKKKDISFYSGVPDSLLKNICAYISDNFDNNHNIIAANEGAAVGIAAGYHLATGKIPVVYMQNSGLGNAINPLVSLIDNKVYNIPLLILIGWRGEPGQHDEPQHKKQGEITLELLDTLGIEYSVLSKEVDVVLKQIDKGIDYIINSNNAYAFVIQKDTFSNYDLQNTVKELVDINLTREEAIQVITSFISDDDVIVSTTGMISRELFEYRETMNSGHDRDFLTVGSMGHASQIALGIAINQKNKKIYCFDGDGSLLMHMGSLAIIASRNPKNYIHIIFNNGAHDSVGGQPTVAFEIDIPRIAKSCGYKKCYSVKDKKELLKIIKVITEEEGPILLEIIVKKGNRANLGRPTSSPIQNKESLMAFLK